MHTPEHTGARPHARTAPAPASEPAEPAARPGPGRILNLGILAHVDAGKTSLTERLLYETGSIDRLGSVDDGSTQTDTDALERQRGITVRSAVASFTVGRTQVNLIDTPGHADFIAEVERALSVLDGAVLVLSAVEGVQAQTRVLMRTLRELGLPTLLFINKIDRKGARAGALLDDVRAKLAPLVVPLTHVQDLGTKAARAVPLAPADPDTGARIGEILAESDDTTLARVVDGPPLTPAELTAGLARQTASGTVHPVYFGSAISGEGIGALLDGITTLLPATGRREGAPRDRTPHGAVFAVERAASGTKTAYLRLFAGELAARQRVTLHRVLPDGTREEYGGQLTRLSVIGAESARSRDAVLTAGGIARIGGLPEVRVGDLLGDPYGESGDEGASVQRARPKLAAPTLRSVVRAAEDGPEPAARLHAALLRIAEQDPLIQARAEDGGGTSVLLYGEVQKEIIGATLERDFGVRAVFEPSRTVYIERVVGTGEAHEEMGATGRNTPSPSGYWATVGLQVAPGPEGSGVVFRYRTELGALPRAFHVAIEESVRDALRRGPRGLGVTDCVVTLTRSGFGGPVSTAADFRGLVPLVLFRALADAGTRVYEPYLDFEAEVPGDTVAAVAAWLAECGAALSGAAPAGAAWLLHGALPARAAPTALHRLAPLTRGEAVCLTRPAGYAPTTG